VVVWTVVDVDDARGRETCAVVALGVDGGVLSGVVLAW